MAYSSVLTVTTPAPDYALVPLATVKDELDVTDSSVDLRLARWTLEASAAVRKEIGGRVLLQESVTETYRAENWHHHSVWHPIWHSGAVYQSGDVVPGLRVRRFPIASVASITEDGILLDPAADYEIDPDRGLIYRLSGSFRVAWWGLQIVVAYTGGYLQADIPGEVQTACLLLLRHRRSAQGRDPMLRQQTVPGVIEQQFWVGSGSASSVPPEVSGLLENYRDAAI